MPVTAYPALILFALIASCNWLFLRKGHSLTPLVGPILLFLGSIKWAEPWYYWLLLLLDPGSITTLLDLPAIIKLIWDGSFVNRTATYRSPQHTLRLYRNGSFELEYEPGKAELAACEGEIDCGCNGNWRREADKLHLFHGSAPLVCFAIAQTNGREYLLAEHPDPPFRLHGVHLFRR